MIDMIPAPALAVVMSAINEPNSPVVNAALLRIAAEQLTVQCEACKVCADLDDLCEPQPGRGGAGRNRAGTAWRNRRTVPDGTPASARPCAPCGTLGGPP